MFVYVSCWPNTNREWRVGAATKNVLVPMFVYVSCWPNTNREWRVGAATKNVLVPMFVYVSCWPNTNREWRVGAATKNVLVPMFVYVSCWPNTNREWRVGAATKNVLVPMFVSTLATKTRLELDDRCLGIAAGVSSECICWLLRSECLIRNGTGLKNNTFLQQLMNPRHPFTIVDIYLFIQSVLILILPPRISTFKCW